MNSKVSAEECKAREQVVMMMLNLKFCTRNKGGLFLGFFFCWTGCEEVRLIHKCPFQLCEILGLNPYCKLHASMYERQNVYFIKHFITQTMKYA